MQNFMPYPKDLTPAQRARLKLYWHIAFIVAFNGIMAAIAVLDQNRSGIDWQVLATSVVAQMALAAFDVMKKYVAASGDVPLATLLDLARNEVAAHAPTMKYTANEQAVQQSVSNLFAQSDAAPTMQYSAVSKDLTANTTLASAPQTTAPASSPSQHPPIDGTQETVTTLPNIAAIQARNATPQG